MITITRRQARRLRAVFRRHAARHHPQGAQCRRSSSAPTRTTGCASGTTRPPWPSSTPCRARTGRRGRSPCRSTPWPTSRARTTRPSSWRPPRRAGPSSAGTTGASPRPASTPSPTSRACRRSPPRRPRPESCPADLLDALAEAAATTDEGSTRYALDCLQLKGATGEVVATDGRQILIQGGFRFPWDGDLLVRRTPLFAVRELPRDRPVEVGRTDAHVVLRAGPWTIWLAIRADARFPRIEHAIPDGAGGGHPAPPRPRGRRVPGPVAGPAARRRRPQRPGHRRPQRQGRRAGAGRGRGPRHRAGPGPLGLHRRAGAAQHQPALPGAGGAAGLRRGPGRRARGPGGVPGRPQGVPVAALVAGVGPRAVGRRGPHRLRRHRTGRRAGRNPGRRRKSTMVDTVPDPRPGAALPGATHGVANGVAADGMSGWWR